MKDTPKYPQFEEGFNKLGITFYSRTGAAKNFDLYKYGKYDFVFCLGCGFISIGENKKPILMIRHSITHTSPPNRIVELLNKKIKLSDGKLTILKTA